MKRLIYLTYLGLLALMLISCEKEQILPADAASDLQANKGRQNNCNTYSYSTKTGVVELGSARIDFVVVAFDPQVTPAQQLTILSRFNIVNAISNSTYNDSGQEMQIVELKPNATCSSVEAMLAQLEANSQVLFANPTFNAPPNSGLLWMAATSEFLVTLANPSQISKLQKLASITNTVIVDDLGFGTYLMRTTKNSTGDALQMSTYFNHSPFISIAEPNFLYQLAPMKYQKRSDLKRAEILAEN